MLDQTQLSLVVLSVRKEFSWEMSTTTASRLFGLTSLKWSSSLWSLAKFTNTCKGGKGQTWPKTKTRSSESRVRTYLVQSCLGNGVVLDAEGLLVLREQGEDSCKRGEGGGQLVLQHVAVFLLQRAAGELPLNEFHHWSEVWIWSSHPQDDGVAIAKPDNAVFVSLLSAPLKIQTSATCARFGSPTCFWGVARCPGSGTCRWPWWPFWYRALHIPPCCTETDQCCSSGRTDNKLYSFLFDIFNSI